MKPRSLAFRLTAILGVAWLVFFLALGAGLWHTSRGLVEQAQADKAQALASQLAAVSLDAVLMRDYGTLERYLADLAGSVAFIEVRRGDGQVLGRVGQLNPDLAVSRAPMRVNGGGLTEQVGEVVAQYDPAPGRRAAWQLVGLLAAGLTLFAGLTFWALRRLLMDQLIRPVVSLIDQASPDRIPIDTPAPAPLEIAQLAQAIKGLQARIQRHVTEAEEAAQARNEALRRLCSEQRLAAVGQMAGEVAHELNTPLSNILGYAQLALLEARDAAQREALGTIEAQARRAGQIVRDMLNTARAPAPSLETLDLTELCAGFARLVTPLARRQSSVIRLQANGPVWARADAAGVEQILFNLCFNAIQAGARSVVLDLHAGPTPSLTISDDGPGLPESVEFRLFEPFVTTKPAGQGTGLGLAICQRLAREMEARLTLEQARPGCRFRLDFAAPVTDPAS